MPRYYDRPYIDAVDFFDTFPEIDKIPYASWAVTHIAEVRPNVRGEWINHTTNRFGPKLNDCIECSQCGIWFSTENLIRRTYCPNCGSYNAGSENDT